MAEINLLQNNQSQGAKLDTSNLLNTIGIILLSTAVLGYAALFILNASASSQTADYQKKIDQFREQIRSDQQYDQLVKYQDKSHNLKLALAKHLNWSKIIDEFSAATLKTAVFDKFVANSDGSANITGFVPSFAELDKQIKAYQLKDFQYIKDVKLVSVSLSSETRIGIDFTLRVTFNTEILQASKGSK